MSISKPLGFHPLPGQVKNVVLSSGNEIKRRASRSSSSNFSMNTSHDILFVYSHRSVDVGETVHLRFGPNMRHSFSIGFFVYVGFTNKDPKSLNCVVPSTNIPGYFLSKIYTSNTSKLSFTLDPSGTIDFDGSCVGNDPQKSLDLGEITCPYWAVIGVPEHPFYVEIIPPPSDAKPIPGQHQNAAWNKKKNYKTNKQVNPLKNKNGLEILSNLAQGVKGMDREVSSTNAAVLEVSQPSDINTVVSFPTANIPVKSSLHATDAAISSPSFNTVAKAVENPADDNSIHIATGSAGSSHQQVTSNEEYNQNNLDVEALLKETTEQTDTQTKRCYKIIFSVITLSVIAVAFTLYFTLIR